MGQILRRVHELERQAQAQAQAQAQGSSSPHHGHPSPSRTPRPRRSLDLKGRDLHDLPPELGVLVLSNLNATDLCLAACVWEDLATDETLWHALCRSQWGHVSAYRRRREEGFSFRSLYMQLDEAQLTFNADADLGLDYILKHGLVEDDPYEIAKFLHHAVHIDWRKKQHLLDRRRDVLDELVKLQNFEDQFLPNALRKFFNETRPPNERGSYLHTLVEKFSDRFCACNPNLGLSKDTVYVVCFSLIMLSVDLGSPHIKNKMSKREFIRNTRRAAEGINDDFAGHLYDNIYLIGHVAPES